MQDKKNNSKITEPIIINLGKRRHSDINALKHGNGNLIAEVTEVLEEVQIQFDEVEGIEVENSILLPVILLYEVERR
ncbi:MAG: hypothetical protein AAF125_19290 [Chloroflexota bacterium]